MDRIEIFRSNLERIRTEKGIDAKSLSLQAGLNERAVKDIESGNAKSPKLSTALALSHALNVSLIEMLGGASQDQIDQDLRDFLLSCSEDQQRRLLQAAQALFPKAE